MGWKTKPGTRCSAGWGVETVPQRFMRGWMPCTVVGLGGGAGVTDGASSIGADMPALRSPNSDKRLAPDSAAKLSAGRSEEPCAAVLGLN